MILSESGPNHSNRFYIGTYTFTGNNSSSGTGSRGIYSTLLDPETGTLEPPTLQAEVLNPSYLIVSRDRRYLYACLETEEYNGIPGGAVAAFQIDAGSGALSLIGITPADGNTPCHLCLDSKKPFLYTANYLQGTFQSFSVLHDGRIGDCTATIRHQKDFQSVKNPAEPRAHFVSTGPDGDYIWTVDLGLDKIILYKNPEYQNPFTRYKTISVKPGSGPRHLEFYPGGHFFYVISELASTVKVYRYSPDYHTIRLIQTISTLPKGYAGCSFCSAIHLSPAGNFLFASNRGHNSITVFRVDGETGKLIVVSCQSTEGEYPRDFGIHPGGKYILAANQHSGTLVPFSFNGESGKLEQTADAIRVPSPVCVQFCL